MTGHGDYHGDRMSIATEFLRERIRQLDKFGFQDIPFKDDRYNCAVYGLLSEEAAKFLTDQAMEDKTLTSVHIIVEELCEAISADSIEEARKELVQLGACVVAAIERIDARAAS